MLEILDMNGDMLRAQKIAILYQALPPPVIDGLRKDAKPGGYSDGGADIGFNLRAWGQDVVTPQAASDPNVPLDWVFPDTREGIEAARQKGATLLWANTVLFHGHPLEQVLDQFWIVGQLPAAMQAGDDKFATNALLRAHGLPVAASLRAAPEARAGVWALSALDEDALASEGLVFPLVVKPVRGRGSQGVSRVESHAAFMTAAQELISSGRFGADVIVEQYLPGDELTFSILPGHAGEAPLALPPVLRFNHHDGVAPYNGLVAVTQNSRALTPAEQEAQGVQAITKACMEAATLVESRALSRIDCRADADGMFRIFDLNMKPNLTGAGRPGREDQDSLTAIAARAHGWSYAELLVKMAGLAWKEQAAAG